MSNKIILKAIDIFNLPKEIVIPKIEEISGKYPVETIISYLKRLAIDRDEVYLSSLKSENINKNYGIDTDWLNTSNEPSELVPELSEF